MDCSLSHYTDYLLSVPKYATATGMSQVFDFKISHDKITRFLAGVYLDNTSVWKAEGCLSRTGRTWAPSQETTVSGRRMLIQRAVIE